MGRRPDFFVVGQPKSGTTALYEVLRAHPQIYMPPIKEPTFLASDVRADARRVDKIEGTSKYTIGLSFHPLKAETDKAIIEFINRRQVDLRNRGLG